MCSLWEYRVRLDLLGVEQMVVWSELGFRGGIRSCRLVRRRSLEAHQTVHCGQRFWKVVRSICSWESLVSGRVTSGLGRIGWERRVLKTAVDGARRVLLAKGMGGGWQGLKAMAVTRRAGSCGQQGIKTRVKWPVMVTTDTHSWAIFNVTVLAAVSFTESWRQKPVQCVCVWGGS